MKKIFNTFAAFTALTVVGGAAMAQTPPAHHGLFGRLFHHPSTVPTGSGMHPMGGGIIGNKNSHVYHMPGDHGSLPAPQNRVYFGSAAQAEAAGYHRAGGGHSYSTTGHSMRSHGMMMPGQSH